MLQTKEKWIVEHSQSQGAYHVSPESEWAENVATCIGIQVDTGFVSDWKVIGECATLEDASRFVMFKKLEGYGK